MLVVFVAVLLWVGATSGDGCVNDTECNDGVSTTPLPLNETTPLPPRSVQLKVYHQDVDTCTCDLHRKFCDVNCCCDKDCSSGDKKVFTGCTLEPNINRDTSFCRYVDHIYVNNTPYEWEVNQNGFFCIVKTNLPPKYTLHSYQAISTFEDSLEQKRNRIVWPETEVERRVLQPGNASYVYGSNIWILRNHTLKVFELSKRFLTHVCLAKEEVRYLEDFVSECTVGNVDAQLQASTYYANVSFISNPRLLNITAEGCPKNICLSIRVKDCSGDNCTPFNDTKVAACEINKKTCWNLVQKVHYNLFHNGSQGLTGVELLLTLKNISYASDEDFNFKQLFKVSFFWQNSTLNLSQSLSGNPGYLTGKPLLLGNLHNGSVFRDSQLVRDNFLTFPASREGACVLTNDHHVLSEFRYNMLLKCRVQKEVVQGNSTASDLCGKMQNEIFAFWPIPINASVDKVVGAFGNANESVLTDWVKVLWSNFSGSVGNFSDGNRTLVCHNLVTTLKVDVFHSKIDLEKLLRQEKVVAMAFDFGPGRTYAFTVGDAIYLDVMIREEVAYFDVTTERVEKFAEPPTFKINLPYDFFYPFVKVGNSAHALCVCHLVKFFMYFNVVTVAARVAY